MKPNPLGPRFLICLLLLLPCAQASAQLINHLANVDCSGATPGAFTSIQTAVNNSPDETAISVSGTCTEVITIESRHNLAIVGNSGAVIQPPDSADGVAVDIDSSDSIDFGNIAIKSGVFVTNSSNTSFINVDIENQHGVGLGGGNSIIDVFEGSITNGSSDAINLSGGSLTLNGPTIANNKGRGVVLGHGHLSAGSPNISNNPSGGILLIDSSEGDIFDNNGPTSITGGKFGLAVQNGSNMNMGGGLITSNNGPGVLCFGHSHCEFRGGTHIDSNSAGGIQVVQHSDLALDGSVEISGNSGPGISLDLLSSLTSAGGSTIANNKGDAIILNTLSAANFAGADTITASPGTFTLNCNNGSMVEGNVKNLKPIKCDGAAQDNSTH